MLWCPSLVSNAFKTFKIMKDGVSHSFGDPDLEEPHLLCLQDPDPDPLVRGKNPDPAPSLF
jgi:hypothetical protein